MRQYLAGFLTTLFLALCLTVADTAGAQQQFQPWLHPTTKEPFFPRGWNLWEDAVIAQPPGRPALEKAKRDLDTIAAGSGNAVVFATTWTYCTDQQKADEELALTLELLDHAHERGVMVIPLLGSEWRKSVYDRGLRRWRIETGWAQEFTHWKEQSRAEANNTTDFIEAALLLAESEPRYCDDAEKMVRNGLLRYQFRDVSWIHKPTKEPSSTFMRTYHDIRGRIRGAFAFALPNDMHSYNADLTGGALQGLCEAWQAAIRDNDGKTKINLFFSRSSNTVDVASCLPCEAQLDIKIKKNTRLLVRRPARAKSIRSKSNESLADAVVNDGYADLGDRHAGETLEVHFGPLEEYDTEETVDPGTCRMRWRADTVIGIDPPGAVAPLYPALKPAAV